MRHLTGQTVRLPEIKKRLCKITEALFFWIKYRNYDNLIINSQEDCHPLKRYHTFIIGHISLDIIITHDGEESFLTGGAVIHSSHSAKAGGNRVGVLTKTALSDRNLLKAFNIGSEDIYYLPSENTTSIRNEFYTADRERRKCTALSIADPFTIADIPEGIQSDIYHLAGLIYGDFSPELITHLSAKGAVAVDMQGFLRVAEKGEMFFRDWALKKELLPHISYLKTDAAEAEVLTGEKEREKAAETLFLWGAPEIMITHNDEVIIFDKEGFHRAPLKPRNLSGRTGRGDTCFSAYITERNQKGVDESLQYAAALVSLKMETPGPFKGSRGDVEQYMKDFY